MAATPPGQMLLRTPPSPLHGAGYDTYEPYAPRKSTRSRRAPIGRQITPEPVHSRATPAKRTSNTSSSKERTSTRGISPPSSPESTPRKKPVKKSKATTHRSASDTIMRDEFAPSAPTLGQPTLQPTTLLSGTTMAEGMLPTPVKTPRKKQVTDVNQAARALFQNQPESLEEVMPTPKRGRKSRKYNGFSLESFEAEGGSSQPNIQIFTDSKDRLPEVDESEDNPFYIKPGRDTSSASHPSKRRKVSGETKRDADVEEHIRKNDGIVYVFRGKKIFRKFDDAAEELDPEVQALLAEHPEIPRTLTRSSIKPRLLFPNEQQRREREARDGKANAVTANEEEADTDIEDENSHTGPTVDEQGAHVRDTSPADGKAQDTPKTHLTPSEPASSHEPSTTSTIKTQDRAASPPTPARNLRSATKKDAVPEESPEQASGKKDGGKISPFQGWKRTKSAAPPSASATAGGKGKNKRMSEEVIDGAGVGGSVAKKAKGH